MRRCTTVVATAAVVAGLAAPLAGADGAPTAPSAAVPPPEAIVVALALRDPLLQAGVVRGRDVILARGFEVELARTLARRLGGRVERFVYVPSAARLVASSASGWQLALGGFERTPDAAAGGDLSDAYLTTDVVVVASSRLERPRRLADLRTTRLCAVRGSAGARAATTVHSRTPPVFVAGTERLQTLLRTGACDAVLVDATQAWRLARDGRVTVGRAVGRIASGEGLVLVVAHGGGLDVRTVDRVLERLRRDGTLGRLARTWLGLDPSALPVLR